MKQYLEAVRQVLEQGTRKENRTKVDTLSTFGLHYNVDLQQGFPLLTTKAINWKNIVVEMLWFLSGQTDISILKRYNCKFWDDWVDADGKVPSAYGNFWRQFPVHKEKTIGGAWAPGEFPEVEKASPVIFRNAEYNDQLKWVVDTLKRDPMSRRMVVSAWAPGNAQTSALPPCHCLFVVNVQYMNRKSEESYCCTAGDSFSKQTGGSGFDHPGDCAVEQRLCLHLTQRSCDIALGVPYNIASYALLMHLLSRFSGIPVGTFSHTLVDAHAYTCKPDGSKAEFDHVPGLLEQLKRQPRPLPSLLISDNITSLEDIEALIASNASTEEVMRHFQLDGYDPHPEIKFKVAV